MDLSARGSGRERAGKAPCRGNIGRLALTTRKPSTDSRGISKVEHKSHGLAEVAQQEAGEEGDVEAAGGLRRVHQLAQAGHIAARRRQQQQPRQVLRTVQAPLRHLRRESEGAI